MDRRLRFSIEVPMPAVALAGIFAVVPTLACAAGAEPLPQWPTLIALDHQTLLSHFTHLRGGKNWWEELVDLPTRKNWWTIATSALCHADAKHRDSNILGLLSAGWKPAHELGALGFALTFFGGHAAAILNTDGQRAQLRNYFNASTGGYTPQLASWASRLWDSALATRYLGGSAGVFALLGVDLCLAAEDLLRLLHAWETVDPEQALLRLGWLGVSIVQTILRVHSEQQSLNAGTSLQVAHVGHLTGFLWGLGVFGALRWVRRVRRSRMRHGHGLGRGHRLGGGGTLGP